jgi:hypothetical protein
MLENSTLSFVILHTPQMPSEVGPVTRALTHLMSHLAWPRRGLSLDNNKLASLAGVTFNFTNME